MTQLTINGIAYDVPEGSTILEACRLHGIEIPVFCYHDHLSVAGNCRMCMVQVEKMAKPVASCAMPVHAGMAVWTTSDMVTHARAGNLEILLKNHPLDCPICDKGGECELQDITMAYGPDRGYVKEDKRAVLDKDLGPLIETHMTRCIHCTRCVRFMREVAGIDHMAVMGRGEREEIVATIEAGLFSPLSGNIIDLCPVGALLSKPYAGRARPWELSATPSIDVHDAVGSNTWIHTRESAVMRVLPRAADAINTVWISDKARFAYDGLRRQRLDRCYVRMGETLRPATWDEAFERIRDEMIRTPRQGVGVIGDLVDVESAFALKEFMGAIGSPHMECRVDGAHMLETPRAGWLFNTTFQGMEAADAILLVGAYPEVEAPLVHARLIKAQQTRQVPTHRVHTVQELLDLLQGNHSFTATLTTAQNPLLLLGMGPLQRSDGALIQALALHIAKHFNMIRHDWVGFNLLHTAAGRVGALEMGCHMQGGMEALYRGVEGGNFTWIYALGADNLDFARLKNTFIIYQGHHGDAGAMHADVVLPAPAYTEKDGIYVNMEGRPQQAQKAAPLLGDAREDHAIIRDLGHVLGLEMPWKGSEELQECLFAAYSHLDPAQPFEQNWAETAETLSAFCAASPLPSVHEFDLLTPFNPALSNFYQTDVVSRASKTMAHARHAELKRREA